MTRIGHKIVVASHNPGKIREIGALLAPLGVVAISAGALGLPEPEETEPTFEGNAILKAKAAADAAGMAALADDSGLAVNALGGAPGIFSARWAGPSKDFGLAMEKVRVALLEKGASDHSASFICVLALAAPGGAVETFRGEVSGSLVFPPRGALGFGYDPIFVPDGFDITFGEMEPERKHAMSHRARAFEKFLAAIG
jgi:XTP/dITP diphosphohydrolase